MHIENCTVTNMATDGIAINGGSTIDVVSTLSRSHGGSGLNVAAGAPQIRVIDSQFSRNGLYGILVASGALDAERMTADQNGSNGVRVQPTAAASVSATLSDSALTGNGKTGAGAIPDVAGATASLAVVRSTSARNTGGGFGTRTFNLGTSFLTVSDSASVENAGNGFIVTDANATGIITRSTIARNTGPDFDQSNGSILRSSAIISATSPSF